MKASYICVHWAAGPLYLKQALRTPDYRIVLWVAGSERRLALHQLNKIPNWINGLDVPRMGK